MTSPQTQDIKAAAAEAVHEVLFELNDDGETYVGREVNRHLDRKSAEIISTLTLRFAIPLVISVFALGGAWYLQSEKIEQNALRIEDGGRFTQEQQDVYAREVDRRFNEIKEDLTTIGEDVRAIRNAVTR